MTDQDQPPLPPDLDRRRRVMGGLFLIAVSIVWEYFFVYRPLRLALNRTGEMTISVYSVGLAPALFYMGVLGLSGVVRTGELRQINSYGKATYTRKGLWTIAGLVVVVGVSLAGWYAYLHALGFAETR